jgi:hypothetical protein
MTLTSFPYQTTQPQAEVTLPVGRHVLELIVTDSAGLQSAPDTVVITVVATSVAPTITSISPSEGQAGATVTADITGTNLAGATAVTFSGAGVTAAIVSVTASSVRVNITIAAGAATGTRTFTVTTPIGTAQSPSGVAFTVVATPAKPTITGISVPGGQQGAAVPAYITGTNLTGATAVTFSGVGVTGAVVSASASSVRVNITIAASAVTGARSFSVTTPAGTAQSPSGVTFTVAAAAAQPAITGIDPDAGLAGNTVAATIIGEKLQQASAVKFFIVNTVIGPTIGPTIVEDPTLMAKIVKATDTKVAVAIEIAADADAGPRGFTVETPAGTAQSWDNKVTFTVNKIIPTIIPTILPTIVPTIGPTIIPTIIPTILPTIIPTILPTISPTIVPTIVPTISPTIGPTISPTIVPTIVPTIGPTIIPTILPTISPTVLPTILPTFRPFEISGRPVTEVRGVGPALAAKLEAAGVADLAALAAMEPGQMAQVLGVSEVRAMAFVDEARRLLTG